MKLSYDPVARELVIDLEDDSCPIEVAVDGLELKLWGDGGILTCEVGRLAMEVRYFPLDEEQARVHATPLGPNHWIVHFVASGHETTR